MATRMKTWHFMLLLAGFGLPCAGSALVGEVQASEAPRRDSMPELVPPNPGPSSMRSARHPYPTQALQQAMGDAVLTSRFLAVQAKEGDCDPGWMQVRAKLDIADPMTMTLMPQYADLLEQPPLATRKPGLLPQVQGPINPVVQFCFTLASNYQSTPAIPIISTPLDCGLWSCVGSLQATWSLAWKVHKDQANRILASDASGPLPWGEDYAKAFKTAGGVLRIGYIYDDGQQPSEIGFDCVVIAGTEIKDSTITARLYDLYANNSSLTKPTPGLLTGIAQHESSYQQFGREAKTQGTIVVNQDCPGISDDRWPKESDDGGSHIGLMQVPTTNEDAWDWLQDTQSGWHIFVNDKLAAARRNASRIRRHHPGLRPLNETELENMAVLLYGPFAPKGSLRVKLRRQYYTVESDSAGTPTWVKNTANNPEGVAYVDQVRAKIHQGGT